MPLRITPGMLNIVSPSGPKLVSHTPHSSMHMRIGRGEPNLRCASRAMPHVPTTIASDAMGPASIAW